VEIGSYIIGFFSFIITVLTGVLTAQAWNNGRWMKLAHQDTLDMLGKMERGQEEARKEMAEARKEMAEARKEMAEAFKAISQLIVAEGEKTRQTIKV